MSVLLGLPLVFARRALDLEMFEFGAKHTEITRKGKEKEFGEYTLHVQCAWRISRQGQVIVASQDRYYPGDGSDGIPDGFDWVLPGNRLDRRLATFFHDFSDLLIVNSIAADSVDGLKLGFENGAALEIFPDDSFLGEFWRFFPLLRTSEGQHFVVTGSGIRKD